jgi:hypothetical protein
MISNAEEGAGCMDVLRGFDRNKKWSLLFLDTIVPPYTICEDGRCELEGLEVMDCRKFDLIEFAGVVRCRGYPYWTDRSVK